jgi:hypothetical protein
MDTQHSHFGHQNQDLSMDLHHYQIQIYYFEFGPFTNDMTSIELAVCDDKFKVSAL